jgi:hypothetical protein
MEANPISITPAVADRFEACGRRHRSVLTLGHAFRKREIRAGRSDPGLLGFGCAELWANLSAHRQRQETEPCRSVTSRQ